MLLFVVYLLLSVAASADQPARLQTLDPGVIKLRESRLYRDAARESFTVDRKSVV